MLLDDVFGRRKAETDAKILGAEQGFENLCHHFIRNSRAGIGNDDFDSVIRGAGGDAQPRLGVAGFRLGVVGHCLAGVLEYVDHGAAQSLWIYRHRRVGQCQVPFEDDTAGKVLLVEQRGELLVDGDHGSVEIFDARVVKQFVDYVVATFNAALDPLHGTNL